MYDSSLKRVRERQKQTSKQERKKENNNLEAGQHFYRAFDRFGQVKFPDDGSILGSSQFSILLQLPSKMLLNSKVVKIDQKIIFSLC